MISMQFYAVHFDTIMFTLHSPLCPVEINASLKHNFFVGIRNTPTPKKDPATSASQAADWVLCYKLDLIIFLVLVLMGTTPPLNDQSYIDLDIVFSYFLP